MATRSALNEPVITGPFSLYEDSFILEFLKPDPSRNASVLMRATYRHDNALCKKGKGHPQSPPLHLHFDQSETFKVLSGKVGTTATYDLVDRVWTASDPAHEIAPWTPHSFWPSADSTEDAVFLVWAHPDGTPEAMDQLFFQNILMYVSDIHEKKAGLDPLQLMLMQHVTATAFVWFPTWKFMGPLRWWIPFQFQKGLSVIARSFGYIPIIEKYTPAADWQKFKHAKTE